MAKLQSFNEHIEMLFKYWDGEITEEQLQESPHFGISKEVDEEMQKDRFY